MDEGSNFYQVVDGIKTDVTFDPRVALEFMDTNGNGIEDKIEWLVPVGVTEFYIESSITIINVQSYPIVGGTWEVEFTSTGQADLVITAIDDTTWTDVLIQNNSNSEEIADLYAQLDELNIQLGGKEAEYIKTTRRLC